jgi:acyl-CoA reductase-like NAD-dependent aldehyde dehydrogenase
METDLKYIKIGKDEGAKMLCGGHRLEGEAYSHGWFVAPTVFARMSIPKMRIAQEEIFGPVVSIIPCDGLETPSRSPTTSSTDLSSSIYTKDVNKAFTAMRDLYAGITYINAPTIGAEVHLPFGGVKATGNGHREGGIGAIDFYTEWKSVYVDYSDSGQLQSARIIDRPSRAIRRPLKYGASRLPAGPLPSKQNRSAAQLRVCPGSAGRKPVP